MFESIKNRFFAKATVEEPEAPIDLQLTVPLGFNKMAIGHTFSEFEGMICPTLVITPRLEGMVPNDYMELDRPPAGSILIPFADPASAHALIKVILDSLVQDFVAEVDEPAND